MPAPKLERLNVGPVCVSPRLAQTFLGEPGFYFLLVRRCRDAEQENELGTANRKTKVGCVAPPTAQASSAEAPFLIALINLTQLHCLLMCECVGPFLKNASATASARETSRIHS